MSLIDPAIVKVLIDTQIETVSGSVIQTIMHAGDVVPHNKDRWIKVVAIDLDSLPMDREDATDATGLDAAAITVTVNCFASQRAMRTKSGALASVMAEVRRVLHRATLRDASSTHQIDLTEVRSVEDREVDEQRRTSTGMVQATGTVTRLTGATMTAFV